MVTSLLFRPPSWFITCICWFIYSSTSGFIVLHQSFFNSFVKCKIIVYYKNSSDIFDFIFACATSLKCDVVSVSRGRELRYIDFHEKEWLARFKKLCPHRNFRAPNMAEHFEPCSIRCPGMSGFVPTLQCRMCLCLFHPECVGLSLTGELTGYMCMVSPFYLYC